MEGPQEHCPARAPQYVAAMSACLGALSVGSILGFSSPAGLQLTQLVNATGSENFGLLNDTSFNMNVFDDSFHLTDVKMAWVSSIVSLGAMCGGLAGGAALNIFGRRGTMLLSTIPAVIGWLLISLAVNFSMLVAGRVATGVFVGLTCLSVNTYIGEIASPDIRGTLGTGFQLMVNFGFLLSYSFGAILKWYYLALECAAIPVLFCVAMFFNKESPSYLLMRDKEEEATKSLRFFRGPNYDIQPEMRALRTFQENAKQSPWRVSDLRAPHILRPVLISITLMFFQQFSGANAVLFNLSVIFQSAGTNLSESTSSIIVGVVFVLGTFVGSFFIDRMGRKVLLVGSAVMMCAAHVGLGLFFYELKHNKAWALTYLQWLPLMAVVIFILGFAIGFAPVPWLMMGELFPTSVRGLASGVATASNWLFSFVVTVSFESLQNVIHDYGVFWLFAGMCLLATLFSGFLVTETKGKTLDEISEMFGGPSAVRREEETDGTEREPLRIT